MNIFVTVGMSLWPFDRLLEAVRPLCGSHSVIVQVGPSKVKLPCHTVSFLPFQDFLNEVERAEIVITHAGNTVRVVQRKGKVPIAMARRAAEGEMPNDHQVRYLQWEQQHGRVVALWDPKDLSKLVEVHLENQVHIMATRALPERVPGPALAGLLNELCEKWVR
jgi:UDP-N-acetylglucosamine transferase subunit ALG13